MKGIRFAALVIVLIFFTCSGVDAREMKYSYEECKGNMTLYLLKNIEIKPRQPKPKIDTVIDDEIVDVIDKEAKKADVPRNLMVAMCEVESGGDPNVTGLNGDAGLFQIIPGYNYERMDRLGVSDIYDPKQNAMVAADILKELSEECDGDLYAVLMLYNEGYSGKMRAKRGIYSEYATKIMARYAEIGL